jgi:aspartate kinase
MKFGGTSVEDACAFERVAQIVQEREALQPVVIVSAMSRVTDALLYSIQEAAGGNATHAASTLEEQFERHTRVANSLLGAEAAVRFELLIDNVRSEIQDLLHQVAGHILPLPFLQDAIVSHGERLSANVLTAILQQKDLPSHYVDARRCITTDASYGCAVPLSEETERRTRVELLPLLEAGRIPVLGGFIAAAVNGETTTLGRGSSDYSAALVGAALYAREIQIWTDVPGVLTADPRLVRTARIIPSLSYREAAELAYFGAKVLHPKTIRPAMERSIPVRVCSSREPGEAGTTVFSEIETGPSPIKAIVHKTGITTVQITSARMLGTFGFLRAIFEVFERHRTIVDVVTTSEVSISLSLDDTRALGDIIAELQHLGTVVIERERAIVCVVGEGLRTTPGVSARVLSTISDINVSLVSLGASSINFTFIIEEERVDEAVKRLHQACFELVTEEAGTSIRS